jgi:putative tricarboxylic transport membrane protein
MLQSWITRIACGLRWGLIAATCVLLVPDGSWAAGYPSKPIEVVVPFSQGGGTDRVGRAFAEYSKKYFGVDTFVTNRTGGSGAVGFQYAASARPDGYVICVIVTTLAVAPSTIEGYPVSYKDFEPIGLFVSLPLVLFVTADSPYKTIDDVVAAAKAHPDKLVFGTAGVGTNNYLGAVAFTNAAGIKAKILPFGGAGPVLTGLLGGHIDVGVADASEGLPYFQNGQTRALLVLGNKPVAIYPGVPLAESKGWDVDIGSFRGVGAPKGTPPAVMAKLVDVFEKTAHDKDFLAYMKKFGMQVEPVVGKQFGNWLKKQTETYAMAAKAAGMTQ